MILRSWGAGGGGGVGVNDDILCSNGDFAGWLQCIATIGNGSQVLKLNSIMTHGT